MVPARRPCRYCISAWTLGPATLQIPTTSAAGSIDSMSFAFFIGSMRAIIRARGSVIGAAWAGVRTQCWCPVKNAIAPNAAQIPQPICSSSELEGLGGAFCFFCGGASIS